jgi:hypothetical protein
MIYGILLESCRDGVCEIYGQTIWKRIVQELNFEHESFTTLGRYDETLIEKVAECKRKRIGFHHLVFFRLRFIGNFT